MPWCNSYFSLRPRRIEIVSSTVGSSTKTGWKRLARAASFSTYLRYSSSVVAPTQCSSPRASAGFSMLPASIAPSALPAPTIVCSSSMNRMTCPSCFARSLSPAFSPSAPPPSLLREFVDRGFHPPHNPPANFRAGDQRAHVEREDALVLQALRHFAVDDALRQALDDRGLADAGFADEHRVVLGAAPEHLHRAAELVVAGE